mmetsp:Transcript_10756/g.32071  ORF Transcript_10756/g.32071 Transcript_10756/m.32071 type:complete len:153 (+) Transcript_10756:98-556(+)
MADEPAAKKSKTDNPYADWQSTKTADGKIYYFNSVTKATSWDWPPKDTTPAPAPAPDDGVPDFEATPTFLGYRPGRVFKKGDKGQGYYRDAPPGADEKKFAGNLSFYPSPTFAGYRAGMVFRRGERGQGYYKDNPCGGVPIGQRWQRYNPFA